MAARLEPDEIRKLLSSIIAKGEAIEPEEEQFLNAYFNAYDRMNERDRNDDNSNRSYERIAAAIDALKSGRVLVECAVLEPRNKAISFLRREVASIDLIPVSRHGNGATAKLSWNSDGTGFGLSGDILDVANFHGLWIVMPNQDRHEFMWKSRPKVDTGVLLGGTGPVLDPSDRKRKLHWLCSNVLCHRAEVTDSGYKFHICSPYPFLIEETIVKTIDDSFCTLESSISRQVIRLSPEGDADEMPKDHFKKRPLFAMRIDLPFAEESGTYRRYRPLDIDEAMTGIDSFDTRQWLSFATCVPAPLADREEIFFQYPTGFLTPDGTVIILEFSRTVHDGTS